MAKTTGPLFSLTASGKLGGTLVYSIWKGLPYVRQLVIPTYSNTTDQATMRSLVTALSQGWKAGSTIDGHAINASYKAAYDTAAAGMAMSGFNLFMKENIAENGGTAYTGDLTIRTAPVGA